MPRIPTVFIGIGGEGTEVVRSVRRKIMAMSAVDTEFEPALYQYVSMDPAPPELKGDETTLPSPIDCAVMAGFDARTVERCLRQPVYSDMEKAWYDGYRPASCFAGYNQIRLNGRFGFRFSCNEPGEKVLTAIDEAIKRACDVQGPGLGAGQANALLVVLSASMCGGTGAGGYLDLAYMVRLMAQNRGRRAKIIGVFTLPEVMNLKFPGTLMQYANSYAWLREMNWYMDKPSHKPSESNRSTAYEARITPQYTIKEGAGGNLAETRPMDLCFLVSTDGLQGGVLTNYQAVLDMLVESLYLMTAATKQVEYLVNEGAPIVAVPGSNEIRPAKFGGFGSKTIRFPAERVVAYLMRRAACDFLPSYVMHPEGAQREAESRFSNSLKNHLSFESVAGEIRDNLPGHDLRVEAQAENVNPKGVPLRKFLETITKACEHEVTAKNTRMMRELQAFVDEYRLGLCEQIQRDVDEIFAEKDNANAIGEAAVYLSLVKRYCVGLVGDGMEPRKEDDRTLIEQANELREAAMEWTEDSSVKRARVEDKWRLFSRGDYKAGVLNAARSIVEDLIESRLYEMLHEMYREVRDFAELRKKPLRFLQEMVADGLKQEFESRPEADLMSGAHDASGGGFEELICADVKTVDQVVAPNVDFFNERNPERREKGLRAAAVSMLPGVFAIYQGMQTELESISRDHDSYLEQRRERYKGELKEILERELGNRIREQLKSKFNIGHALLQYAVEQGHADDQVSFVRNLLKKLATAPEVFCGMDMQTPGSYGFTPDVSRMVCVEATELNKAISHASGQPFDVAHGVFPNSVRLEEDFTDVFRVTSLVTHKGWPLFGLNRISEYHGLYDEVKQSRRAIPLHIDKRYEKDDYDNQYRLPLVEVLGKADDPDILLFCLAEQDWWRDLDGFPSDSSDVWAGDIDPMVWREGTRHYYNWRARDGKKDGCLGRENAQKAFIRDKKDVKQGVYGEISRRWNSSFNKPEKRRLLTQLAQETAKQLEQSSHNDLRRCYENEIRIINERLEEDALDI